MKLKIIALVLGLALFAAACNKPANNDNANSENNNGANTQTSDNSANATQSGPITVQMKEQNSSKESGTVMLTPVGSNQTQVKVDLSNGPATSQPAHIHVGACPNPGAVKYALNSVVSGHSTTVIDVNLDDLLTQLPLAVNVHKSAAESSVYVSCGDITANPQNSSTAPKTVTINMTASGFSPSTITINKGDTVTFVNQDTKSHWPASAPHPTHTDYSAFDPKKAIAPGETWSFTFDQVGTWKFHDHLNPSKFGSVTVQ